VAEMTDHKELFLFAKAVPSKADENAFIERLVLYLIL
jgi:hypothetical protein